MEVSMGSLSNLVDEVLQAGRNKGALGAYGEVEGFGWGVAFVTASGLRA